MYGINLITLANIITTTVVPNLVFGDHGVGKIIINNIEKFAYEQNIEMVQSMLNTLARQNEKIYNEVLKILKAHYSKEEIEYLLK